jgi:PAS domain S-box-containing protein
MGTSQTEAELQSALAQANRRIAELEAALTATSANQSEARFASVFRASPAQMALTDSATGQYVEVNDAFLQTLGFSRAEVIGKTAVALNLFHDPAQRAELLGRMAAQGYLRDEPVRVRTRTGAVRQGIFTAEYIYANGQKLLLTVMNDVTERLQAEARWQFALEGAGDGVWDWDAQTDRVFYSRQWKAMLGYAEAEIGDTLAEWTTRVHPDDLAATLAKMHAHLAGATPFYSSEHRVRCKDGTYKWILDRGQVIERAADGRPLRVIGTHKDISESKQMETSLRESEARFRSFMEQSADGFLLTDEQGVIIEWNQALTRITGLEREAARGLTMWDFQSRLTTPEKRPALEHAKAILQEILRGGQSPYLERVTDAEIQTVHGARKFIQQASFAIRTAQGYRIGAVVRDVTEFKQAEAATRVALTKYATLFDSFPLGITVADASGKILEANAMAEQLLGVSAAEHTQREIDGAEWRLIRPDGSPMPADEYASVRALTEGRKVENVEMGIVKPDASVTWINVTAAPLPLAGYGVVVAYGDITARKRAEEAQRESRARLEAALESTTDAVFISDVDGNFVDFNEAFATFHKFQNKEECARTLAAYPQFLDVFLDTGEPAPLAMWAAPRALRGERVTHAEYLLRRKDTGECWVGSYSFAPIRDANGAIVGAVVVGRDVTESKRVQEALRAEQLRFAKVADTVPGVLCTFQLHPDGSLNMPYASNAIVDVYGLTQAAVAENIHAIIERVPADQVPGLVAVLHESARTLQPWHSEYQYRHPVKGDIWIEGFSTPVREADGSILWHGISTDITERKRAEEALRASEEKYRRLSAELEARVRQRTAEVQDLYDNAPTGYHSLDPEGRFVAINRTELTWLGYTRAETLGHVFQEFITTESAARFSEAFSAFKKYGRITDLELEMRRKDGASFPVVLNSVAVFDEHGSYLRSRGTLFDNTARKQAENDLRESEAQNRLLFEASPDAIVLFDQARRVVRMNRACEALMGIPRAQFIGHGPDELNLLPREQIERLARAVAPTRERRTESAAIEFTLNQPAGDVREVGARVFALDLGGQPHYLATLRDITERKQAEAALRHALEQERELNELKSRFISMTSHEFRTPLTTILSSAELIQIYGARWSDERKQVHFGRIRSAVRNMTRLLDDILILGRGEAGRLTFAPAPLDLAQFCGSLIEELQLGVGAGYTLEFTSAGECGAVHMDEKLLRHILGNLLSNALKYSPAGGRVRLALHCAGGQATFTVQDQGIGIPADAQPRLFETFHRAHNVGAIPGTGLGLAIVKKSVDLHGGAITFVSAEGKGTTFTITLPTENE